jgi:ubiquinone/menaquinone biosynthesis C-methylase UbiE
VGYVLGSAPTELQRLIRQSQIISPVTERLLRQTAVKQGMRVLDVGCGAGDVSLLAAEMVGTSGSIIGIDRSGGKLPGKSANLRTGAGTKLGREQSFISFFSY